MTDNNPMAMQTENPSNSQILAAFSPDETRALLAHEPVSITTNEQLWEQIKKDGIPKLAKDTGISEERFIEILIKPWREEAESEQQKRLTWLGLRRLWWIVLGIGVFILLGILLVYLRRTEPTPTEQAIVAAVDLPAFHLIQTSEVVTKVAPKETGAHKSPTEVVNRYTLQPVAAGTILRADHLAPLPQTNLANRQLVGLPIEEGAIIETLAPGDHISIVLAPREHCCDPIPPPLVLNNAIVWIVDRRDNAASIVVAVEGTNCEATVAPYLAVSDVFMVQLVGDAAAPSPDLTPVSQFCSSAFTSKSFTRDPTGGPDPPATTPPAPPAMTPTASTPPSPTSSTSPTVTPVPSTVTPPRPSTTPTPSTATAVISPTAGVVSPAPGTPTSPPPPEPTSIAVQPTTPNVVLPTRDDTTQVIQPSPLVGQSSEAIVTAQAGGVPTKLPETGGDIVSYQLPEMLGLTLIGAWLSMIILRYLVHKHNK